MNDATKYIGSGLCFEEVEEFMSHSDSTPEPHSPQWFAKGHIREALRQQPELLP